MLVSVDWGTVSSTLGVASIFTWLFAQSPQVYENYKRGSVEGLALPFLVSWFLGDFTNLLGCVLTHQLPFQTWLAAYFILVDVVLCAQFAYYSRLRPVPQFPPLSEGFPYAQPSPHASARPCARSTRPSRRSTARPLRTVASATLHGRAGRGRPDAGAGTAAHEQQSEQAAAADEAEHEHRVPLEYDWERVIGRTSAWVCTTAYLTSRLPQIWQNFRRRSVEGLAMTLFAAAFLGNSLYVASILTNPLASSTRYLLESTPYLLGSGGTLCFDLMIIGQSWLYSDKRKARRDRERRRRGAHGFDAEEEAALLHGDGAGDGGLGDGYGDGEAHKVRRTGSRIKPQRSRSTSTLGARSISAGRTLSTSRGPRRSESTELVPGAGGSRGARFLVSPHDAEHALALDNGDDDGASLDGPSRSVSRGSSTRVLSRQPSFDAIQEEGESSVTLRGADD
ncbi:PQ loop repeat-domain-containing protein [Rhodotorula diobovata]|uniref:PQ loop repeat-domain-containing protein n=1 Tax=Rhodotorula diobovata TaxID=5288 RepID=A0A5C5FW23_9BASI|nr:PQ loop repeat-domain-containing protein [Rhodotorula diobovata]